MISHNPIYACRLRTYSCVVKNSIKNIIVINANLLISMRELRYVSRPLYGDRDSGFREIPESSNVYLLNLYVLILAKEF